MRNLHILRKRFLALILSIIGLGIILLMSPSLFGQNALSAGFEAVSGTSGARLEWDGGMETGAAPSALQDNAYPSQPQDEAVTQEPLYAGSTRILLWAAFILALVVFTVSVIGAILLYDRQLVS